MTDNTKVIAAAWEAIGTYSIEICRPDAELAPPQYLCDAMLAIETALRTARAEALALREACNGLLGLFQLIDGRDDIPAEAKAAFMNNHRIIDAQLLLARLASDPPGGG